MVFQGLLQPRTKYLRKTLVFMWRRALREASSFYWESFAGAGKILVLGNFFGGVRRQCGGLQLHEILTLLSIVNCEVLIRLATREATRTHQFITNNQASFHLWGKKKLVKHQNFSKYYDHSCRLLKILFPFHLKCKGFSKHKHEYACL